MKRSPIRLSFRKKLLFAALTTVSFFLVLELVLAGLGVRPESTFEDRTAGFSGYSPLFVESTLADGKTVLSTAENKSHWFNNQSFPRRKAAGTVRIFCMGGSTTYGHPYWDETSFPGWLRHYLPITDPDHTYEVINAGGISYGSHRVATLMEELAQYEPDIFIVYSAHNEFLERQAYAGMFEQSTFTANLTALMANTRVWTVADRFVQSTRHKQTADLEKAKQLPNEVDEELNHTAGPTEYHRDEQWKAQVVAHYQSNLKRMIEIANRASSKIVFIMPAANEKDCSPFKSELLSNSPGDRSTMDAMLLSGDQAAQQSNLPSAEESYRQAIQMDEGFAEAHYRLGRLLHSQHNATGAHKELQAAIDADVCPLRAVTEIKKSIHEISRSRSAPLVDFESRLREYAKSETGSELFGSELFLDHVHPTIEVNRQLAIWIIEDLQQKKLFVGQSIKQLHSKLEEIRQKVVSSIDRDDEIFAIRNLAKVIHWSGKFEEAIPLARDVLDLAPGDPESSYIVASCLANLGRTQEALEEYDLLFADGIGYPRAYLPYGELLAANGELEQAKAYLLLAILRKPDSADAYESLGNVHQQLGEVQFAEEAFAKAKKIRAQ